MKNASLFLIAILTSSLAFAAPQKRVKKNTVTTPAVTADGAVSAEVPSEPTRKVITSIMPQASLLVSNVKAADGDDADNKTGFAVGATADININQPNLVVESGLLYRQLGAKSSMTMFDERADMTLRLNYLTIPVLAKYTFSSQGTSSYFTKAGVMPGILVSKEAEISFMGRTQTTSDISGTKDFDLQMAVGAGGKFRLNEKTDFVVEAGYQRSIVTIVKDADAFNTAFNVTGGVSMNL